LFFFRVFRVFRGDFILIVNAQSPMSRIGANVRDQVAGADAAVRFDVVANGGWHGNHENTKVRKHEKKETCKNREPVQEFVAARLALCSFGTLKTCRHNVPTQGSLVEDRSEGFVVEA
jgi:hypothetical protein